MCARARVCAFFPRTKYKYNNGKETFSKGRIFVRITAKSVLTHLGVATAAFLTRDHFAGIRFSSCGIKSLDTLYNRSLISLFLSPSLPLSLSRAIGSTETLDRSNGNLIPPTGNIAGVCLSDIRTRTCGCVCVCGADARM